YQVPEPCEQYIDVETGRLVEWNTNGGSLRMRRRPSFIVVSFPIACRLSRVCAFATNLSVALRSALSGFNRGEVSVDLNCLTASSTSRCAYQTSRIGRVANDRMAVR